MRTMAHQTCPRTMQLCRSCRADQCELMPPAPAEGLSTATPHERDLLCKLVVDLSDTLTDEGADWSGEGLDRLRRRVACAVPLAMLPDWLKPFRPADSVPTVAGQVGRAHFGVARPESE